MRPAGWQVSPLAPSGRPYLSARFRLPPLALPRSAFVSGLHPYPPAGAPVAWPSEALCLRGARAFRSAYRSALHRGPRLVRPLLTSRSVADAPRGPFRPKARSPRIRALTVPTRPPDLRRFPLVTGASWSLAHSPRSPAPCIRFLFVGPWVRSTLPPDARSPSRPCASLPSL